MIIKRNVGEDGGGEREGRDNVCLRSFRSEPLENISLGKRDRVRYRSG